MSRITLLAPGSLRNGVKESRRWGGKWRGEKEYGCGNLGPAHYPQSPFGFRIDRLNYSNRHANIYRKHISVPYVITMQSLHSFPLKIKFYKNKKLYSIEYQSISLGDDELS